MPKGISRKVEDILKKYPETRNSDKLLITYLWKVNYPGAFKMDEQEKWWVAVDSITDLPSTESIRRSRQSFQAKGQYLPTNPEVLRQRARNQKIMHDSHGMAVDVLS